MDDERALASPGGPGRRTWTAALVVVVAALGFSGIGIGLTQRPSTAGALGGPPLTAEDVPGRRLFSEADVASARVVAAETAWGREHVDRQRRRVAPLRGWDDRALQALVPPPGSEFVAGGPSRFDVRGRRFEWAGWAAPRTLRVADGGDLLVGPTDALAPQVNSAIVDRLERRILPALADLYAVTDSVAYARAAAVLLDALAAVSAGTRGPTDAPITLRDPAWGGRLQRPGYQVGRALWNYASVADLVAPSGALDAPSAFGPGTVGAHVADRLLLDSGRYCLAQLERTTGLHNGRADYLRGAAAVGVVLGLDPLVAPLLAGPTRFDVFVTNNVDRNGVYYESSTGYRGFALRIYTRLADLERVARRRGGLAEAPLRPRLARYFDRPGERLAVGGVRPRFGDTAAGARAVPTDDDLLGVWALLATGGPPDRSRAAATLARWRERGLPTGPPERDQGWLLYRVRPADLRAVDAATPARDAGRTTFLGASGLALLRGDGYGARLFFGPVHNHGQREALTWTFYADGAEWSLDPGQAPTQFRFGWTDHSVSHQALVVGRQSVDPAAGSGHLRSWEGGRDVAWAFAAHPDAYRGAGVSRYERLIAQVEDPETGRLGYWLDVGRVVGGRVRDDVFHTQMGTVDVGAPPDRETVRPATERPFRVGLDGRVEGEGERGPRWHPPGEGYRFFGDGRSYDLSRPLASEWTRPLDGGRGALRVDIDGAPGRSLRVAPGPEGPLRGGRLPSVPYAIARDEGPGASVFAKVVRHVPTGPDPVRSFGPVRVTGAGALTRAWRVDWASGAVDVWVVADAAGRRVRAEPAGLAPVVTDGLVTFVRYGPDGRTLRVVAGEATAVDVRGAAALRGAAGHRGRLRGVGALPGGVAFDVGWEGSAPGAGWAGGLVETAPPGGQPTSWTGRGVVGGRVALDDGSARMGLTTLRPGDGCRVMDPAVSRLLGRWALALGRYGLGRTVTAEGAAVGRVAGVEAAPPCLRIAGGPGEGPGAPGPLPVEVWEASPGDGVWVPGRLEWRRPGG